MQRKATCPHKENNIRTTALGWSANKSILLAPNLCQSLRANIHVTHLCRVDSSMSTLSTGSFQGNRQGVSG